MVIDMHTHIWPDHMARETVHKLEMIGRIKAYSDGTLLSLKESMRKGGVDLSVILPVITKPEQFETVNKVASTYTGEDGILSFGGIHPKNDRVVERLTWIKSLGLKGIKLHPDYQKEFFDSVSYQQIVKEALALGLVVVTHAGRDVGLYKEIHCTPDHVVNLYESLCLGDNVDNALVLAHTGGCDQWKEVLDRIAGKKVYLDISFTHGRIDEELFLKIVRKHGADRMMFGTDHPWSSQGETMEWVKSLPLTEQEKDAILYKTAKRILGI